MTQTTINQRIKFLVDKLSPSARAFSEAIAESPTNTFNYIGGRLVEPRANYLAKVVLHFGNVSAHWLLTGEGQAFITEPIASQQQSQNQKKNNDTITNKQGMVTASDLTECQKELQAAQKEITSLNKQLALQEKLIQVYEAQQSKP